MDNNNGKSTGGCQKKQCVQTHRDARYYYNKSVGLQKQLAEKDEIIANLYKKVLELEAYTKNSNGTIQHSCGPEPNRSKLEEVPLSTVPSSSKTGNPVSPKEVKLKSILKKSKKCQSPTLVNFVEKKTPLAEGRISASSTPIAPPKPAPSFAEDKCKQFMGKFADFLLGEHVSILNGWTAAGSLVELFLVQEQIGDTMKKRYRPHLERLAETVFAYTESKKSLPDRKVMLGAINRISI